MRLSLVPPLALAAALLLPAAPARACSLCACGDPLLSSSDPAAITGTLRFQLDTDYVRATAGTEGMPGHTDRVDQWSYRLNAVYRPIEQLSLLATVPLVSKTMDMVGEGRSMRMSSLTGLGDAEVAARWALWRSASFGTGRVHELAVSGGSSLPTGAHDAHAPDGSLIDPHGQLGSGAWGPFAGLSYLFEQGRWLAFASFSGRLRTEAGYADGSRYKFGDALLWSVHGQYRPMRRLAVDLGIDGRYARADRATEADGTVDGRVMNTGGTVLSVAPGLYLETVGGLWLFVRGQLPVVKSLHGEQDVLPSFTTGLQFQVL